MRFLVGVLLMLAGGCTGWLAFPTHDKMSASGHVAGHDVQALPVHNHAPLTIAAVMVAAGALLAISGGKK